MRTIVQENPQRVAVMDVFSKLVQDRIVFIDGEISADLANEVNAQLLYLDSISSEPINVYINSAGGDIIAGFAIFDVMKKIKSRVNTTCLGLAASMGAILLLAGETRNINSNGWVMLHQPNGGIIGTASDIEITHNLFERLKKQLYDVIKDVTNLENVDYLLKDDNWFSSNEALNLNIVTNIL